MFRSIFFVIVASALLTSCGLSSASLRDSSPSFGLWQPVHQFPIAPSSVPLSPVVVYRVTPMDMTLRNLLARWAFVGGKQLRYSLPVDWQVHRDASLVEAASLEDALARLSSAYASQHLVFRVDGAVVSASLSGDSHVTQ